MTLVTGDTGFLRQFLNQNYGARTLGIETGTTSTSSVSDPADSIFPFVSGIIPLSGTPPISRFIMDGTAAQHDLIGSYSDMVYDGKGMTSHTHSYTTARTTGPSTFNFSGGPITIKIYTGNQTSVASSQLIQTLNINVPGGTFPLPQVVRASPPILSGSTYMGGDASFALPTTNNGPNANPLSGGNPYKDAAFYTGFNLVSGVPNATPSDSRYLNQRFSGSYPVAGSSYSGFTYPGFPLPEGSGISSNQQSNYVNPGIPTAANQGATIVNRYGIGNTMATSQYGGLFRRGDVIRSVGIDPNGPSGGDIRLVAGLNNVPSNYFAPLAGYSDSTRYQIHSIFYDSGNFRQSSAFADVLGTNPYLWNTAWTGQGLGGHYLISNPRGSLLNGTSNGYDGTITTAVQGQRGAFLSTQTGFYPGDWDNGIGNIPDGGYLNKPDEGYSSIVGFASVYFQANNSSFTTPTQLSFSPNRQIPSPVMFGSLPTGMLSGNPWQTLLFCPNPASEQGNHSVGASAHHPGFGTPVSGVPGPGALPPFVKPPDHLLLDWFWMPVVQPYAISDPLSTAGKVNMNFQILPFTYIERSTGVRAVLKNVKVLAIPARAANMGQSYKQFMNAFFDSTTPSFRYDINRDETISGGFDARFSGTNGTVPDIFRSASEICNVFLVPQEQVGAQSPPASVSYGDSIAPPAPTGGYAGTANWWDSYQLTGDSSRESPYNQIYPRLTTKSNTFQVHYRVQMLNKQANSDPTVWTEGVDQVGVESRGYQVIERAIDPMNSNIPDYATQPLIQTPISNFYNFYTLESKLFTP